MPARIQRRRTKGWRMPLGAVYVGRPSYFGNPFRVGETTPADWRAPFAGVVVRDAAHAVDLLRSYLAWRAQQPSGWCSPIGPHFPWEHQIRSLLRGRDLVCWCSPGTPCRADVLLTIANTESE
ncbi:DUF4326 domain-containing protein [Streptomyces sp. NPDC052676]|uniref:DUF4326 domain-containing protein n=1 Tax=Streptomyces sp. NPDC052676 TaxID=3154953 RepID=UPI003436CF6E